MSAPVSSTAWSASEILKIRAEGDGPFVGYVDIAPESTTLADIRTKMRADFDFAPEQFNFLLSDGVPVSRRQEATLMAAKFLPVVSVRSAGRVESGTRKVVFRFEGEEVTLASSFSKTTRTKEESEFNSSIKVGKESSNSFIALFS